MEDDEYERESECEDYVDYKPEGYHPVTLGEKFKSTYTVVQKLGWGHFSTVWLVQKEGTEEYLALKIQRSKDSHTESAIDELEMLQQIRKHEKDQPWIDFVKQVQADYPTKVNAKLCRPLLLLDSFAHYGIHGKHLCSVFQLMGPNLLDVIQHYEFKDERMPMWLVKKITRDVLLGLVYLHEYCEIIHTDLKPENIMIKMEENEQRQLVKQLKAYKVKPVSMKYLRNIQASKQPRNKKKQEKKKLKKKKLQNAQNEAKKQNEDNQQEEDQQSSNFPESSQLQKKQSSSIIKERTQIKEIKSQLASDSASELAPANQSEMVSQISKSSSEGMSITQQKKDKLVDDLSILKWKSVSIQLNDKLFFKIVDLGNACFVKKHFTQEIQTRQYRSPEVLLGHSYDCNTDIWSLACIVFEMLTNNFLFKPKKVAGIKKDEEHLFQIIQTLGPLDKDFWSTGIHSSQFFNKKGKLLNGSPKDVIPLSRLLIEKYDYETERALEVQQFLLPMLAYEPKKRIDARSCLKAGWLWK